MREKEGEHQWFFNTIAAFLILVAILLFFVSMILNLIPRLILFLIKNILQKPAEKLKNYATKDLTTIYYQKQQKDELQRKKG